MSDAATVLTRALASHAPSLEATRIARGGKELFVVCAPASRVALGEFAEVATLRRPMHGKYEATIRSRLGPNQAARVLRVAVGHWLVVAILKVLVARISHVLVESIETKAILPNVGHLGVGTVGKGDSTVVLRRIGLPGSRWRPRSVQTAVVSVRGLAHVYAAAAASTLCPEITRRPEIRIPRGRVRACALAANVVAVPAWGVSDERRGHEPCQGRVCKSDHGTYCSGTDDPGCAQWSQPSHINSEGRRLTAGEEPMPSYGAGCWVPPPAPASHQPLSQ